MSYVLAITGMSLRGNGYARAGATPEDGNAWVIVPFEYDSLRVDIGQENPQSRNQLVMRLDPTVVQFFRTRAEARAWWRARSRYRLSQGARGFSCASVWLVKEQRVAA